jgi:hypothetical protein
MLMKNAVRFMSWKRARCMKCSVAGVCGTVRMTKSASGSSESSASGPVQLQHARRRFTTPRVDAHDVHPERGREPCRLAADPADADDQRRGLRQVDHAAVIGLPPPLSPQLSRKVVVESAGERQDERHDVGADVVVVDLAEIGHGRRVSDQRRRIVAGRRRRLRRLEPAQAPGIPDQRVRHRAECRLGFADGARGLGVGLGHHDRKLGQRGREP